MRAEFVAAKEQGKGFADGPLAISWRPRLITPTRTAGGMTSAVARVGLAVSSKVGDAVVRNRVKRRLREAVRHELSALPAVELVIVARASSVKSTVPELRAWLRRAVKRIGVVVPPVTAVLPAPPVVPGARA